MNLESFTGDKLPIPEFSLKEMCKDPSIIMIAKRGSGKSWIARAILHEFRDIPVGIIISPTEDKSPFFSEFFPDSYIYYEYKSDTIKKLLFRQNKIIEKSSEKRQKGKYVDPRAIIVMDDCLASDRSWAKDPQLKELLYNGRHSRVTYLLTMQFVLGIDPKLRGNFDYIFLLAENFTSAKKKIYDHYAGMFPDFNSFREVFDQLTSKFGAMVIKNRGNNATLFDMVAFYKAPNLSNKKFTFGCKQFQKYHKENYNENWKKEKEKIDYQDFLTNKRKNKSKIAVKII